MIQCLKRRYSWLDEMMLLNSSNYSRLQVLYIWIAFRDFHVEPFHSKAEGDGLDRQEGERNISLVRGPITRSIDNAGLLQDLFLPSH